MYQLANPTRMCWSKKSCPTNQVSSRRRPARGLKLWPKHQNWRESWQKSVECTQNSPISCEDFFHVLEMCREIPAYKYFSILVDNTQNLLKAKIWPKVAFRDPKGRVFRSDRRNNHGRPRTASRTSCDRLGLPRLLGSGGRGSYGRLITVEATF